QQVPHQEQHGDREGEGTEPSSERAELLRLLDAQVVLRVTGERGFSHGGTSLCLTAGVPEIVQGTVPSCPVPDLPGRRVTRAGRPVGACGGTTGVGSFPGPPPSQPGGHAGDGGTEPRTGRAAA